MKKLIALAAMIAATLLLVAACASTPQVSGGMAVHAQTTHATVTHATKKKPHKPAKKVTKKKAAPKAPVNILPTQTGSGIANSAPFKAPSHWKLIYTYDCSNMSLDASDPGTGNFIVEVIGSSGFPDPVVNEIGHSGSKTVDEYDSGTVHLSIDSECNWTVGATK